MTRKQVLGIYTAPQPLGGRRLSGALAVLLPQPRRAPEPVSAARLRRTGMRFEPADRPRGVGEHPHRGFETVTIVYQGEVAHRDSTGAGGTIGPGDVQWMTAAGGILHDEFHSPEFTRNGGTLEMVQLWVNLPARDKMSEPGYQHLAAPTSRRWRCPMAPAVCASSPASTTAVAARRRPSPPWTSGTCGCARGTTRACRCSPAHRCRGGAARRRDGQRRGRQWAPSWCCWSATAMEVLIEAASDADPADLSGEPLGSPSSGTARS
jgi:quercetin 2,3-dioxygenase